MAKVILNGDALQSAVLKAVEKDEGFALDLRRAIAVKEGEPISVLQFRPARGRDMRELPFDKTKMKDGELLAVVARLTGVQPALLDDMSAVDVTRANVVAVLFLSGGQ